MVSPQRTGSAPATGSTFDVPRPAPELGILSWVLYVWIKVVAGWAWVARAATRSESDAVKPAETVTVDQGSHMTEVTAFHDGEFIRVDSVGHENAVVWSTSKTLSEVLTEFLKSAKVADAVATVWIRESEIQDDLPASAAVNKILNGPPLDVSDAWIPFRGFVLSWTRATDKTLAEAALIFPDTARLPDARFIESTATDLVRADARRVLARSAIVSVSF